MRRLLTTLVALAVISAACGSSGESGADEPGTTTTSSTSTTSTTAAPTTTTTATTTTTTTEAPPPPRYTVEVATINVLHGFPAASGCTFENDQCLAPTRADILWRYLEDDVGCPEIIALQEISPRWFEIVADKLPELCDGNHVLLTDNIGQVDQEMILTTLPVIDEARMELAGGPIWSAHWAQLDAGDGLVIDVFATHYASSSFNVSCDAIREPITGCGDVCPVDSDLGSCHPFQTLAFLAERAAPGSLQLVIGDLNKQIADDRIQTLIQAGFVDTHLLAGNGECPEAGGTNCTSGIGGDTALDGLDIADQTLRSRIDMILVRAPAGCTAVVDADDTDGDGTRTGIWADTPLDEPVGGLYWGSDHAGIQADIGLDCA